MDSFPVHATQHPPCRVLPSAVLRLASQSTVVGGLVSLAAAATPAGWRASPDLKWIIISACFSSLSSSAFSTLHLTFKHTSFTPVFLLHMSITLKLGYISPTKPTNYLERTVCLFTSKSRMVRQHVYEILPVTIVYTPSLKCHFGMLAQGCSKHFLVYYLTFSSHIFL